MLENPWSAVGNPASALDPSGSSFGPLSLAPVGIHQFLLSRGFYLTSVLGLVFSTPNQEIGLWKRLRDDLFRVEWDVKPRRNQKIKQVYTNS